MSDELTVKEYARTERVDERTVRRWIAKGAVAIRRTPGGGIRIRDERSRSRITFVSLSKHDNSGRPTT